MPRDEAALEQHWRTELRKAYDILDRLWQGPVPTWDSAHTQRDVRQAAHLCRQTVAGLGSSPNTTEAYAEELYNLEHPGEVWDDAGWNLRSLYRERARDELRSMAPPTTDNPLWEIGEEAEPEIEIAARELYARAHAHEKFYVPWHDTVRGVRDTCRLMARAKLAPVRAEQHEQQEELHEHEQCKSVLDHPEIDMADWQEERG